MHSKSVGNPLPVSMFLDESVSVKYIKRTARKCINELSNTFQFSTYKPQF